MDLKNQNLVIWTEYKWLRIECIGGFLWLWWWTFRSHKLQGIYWPTECLPTFQKMSLVSIIIFSSLCIMSSTLVNDLLLHVPVCDFCNNWVSVHLYSQIFSLWFKNLQIYVHSQNQRPTFAVIIRTKKIELPSKFHKQIRRRNDTSSLDVFGLWHDLSNFFLWLSFPETLSFQQVFLLYSVKFLRIFHVFCG